MAVVERDRPQVCTDCGRPSDRLEWFPFAVWACPECAARRRQQVAEEIHTGAVCRFCGKPYSLCIC